MNDSKGRVSAVAVIAVAAVALLTAWFAGHGTGGVPRPSEALTQQSVVTAPPMGASPEAAARANVMGGPPAAHDAKR